MTSQNEAHTDTQANTQTGAIDLLEEKDAAVIELACTIGFGAHQNLNDQFDNARDHGLSDAELNAVVSKAMCVKNSARDLTNKIAYQNLGEVINTTDCCADEEVSRLKEIAAISSAVGAACLTNYQKHLAIGKEAGLSDGEISAVIDKAFMMRSELQEDFEYIAHHPGEAAATSSAAGEQDCCASDSSCCAPSERSSGANSEPDNTGCC